MKIAVTRGNKFDQAKLVVTPDSRNNQDLVVFFVAEGQDISQLDKATSGIASSVQDLVKHKHNQLFVTPTLGKMQAKMMGFAGLGKTAELDHEKIRLIGGTIAKAAKSNRASTVAIDFDGLTISLGHSGESIDSRINQKDSGQARMTREGAARALTEGLLLGNYDYQEFKTVQEDDQPVEVTEVTYMVHGEGAMSDVTSGIAAGTLEAKATIFTRGLVNQPPAQMHPRALNEAAEKIADESNGSITVETFGRDELKKMGANAILAVAQGSEHGPFLIHLHYKPVDAKKSVALVGKGVTFDSGGLSIKPSEAMEDMKMDMAGAATVLGIFSALAELKPDIEIHGVCACVENMVSDRSYRVGDIIRTMSGKTIEVLNTDAEGRIILADALHYATLQKPDMMLDFATLTGACIVALGDQVAALLSNNRPLAGAILSAGQESGEMLCELPLVKEYDEYIKNDVADIQNIG